MWSWGPPQEEAFTKIKEELIQPTVLMTCDPSAPTKISADASSYGLGAVLLQQRNGEWHPVVYASRAMTEEEQHYAQIEKEALATVWACEKFSLYILGKRISIETDHKPLIPLLGHKRLDNLPPRVLRFRLRLMRFDYSIEHTPGKFLYTADALSRSPLPNQPDKDTVEQHEDVEHFISAITSQLSASSEWLSTFAKAQSEDRTCSKVIDYCKHGWPSKYKVPTDLMIYWKCRGQFSLHNELLLFGNRIVIPSHLRKEILTKIHQGHQGIQRCRLRLVTSV